MRNENAVRPPRAGRPFSGRGKENILEHREPRCSPPVAGEIPLQSSKGFDQASPENADAFSEALLPAIDADVNVIVASEETDILQWRPGSEIGIIAPVNPSGVLWLRPFPVEPQQPAGFPFSFETKKSVEAASFQRPTVRPKVQIDIRSDEAAERKEAFEAPDAEDADEHDRRHSRGEDPVIDRQARGEPRQDFAIVAAGGGGDGYEQNQRSQSRRDV
jgi:hypothetical protein